MPTEAQYQQALRELADLERELEALAKACDVHESVKRIQQFIAQTHEGLTDPENITIKKNDGCCQIL